MQITYAGIYDELVPLPEHEVVFYGAMLKRALTRGERVLITPSTTGRLAIALARLGFDVTGIDLDPEMTATALAKKAALPAELHRRLRFETGDMRDVKAETPFGAVIVPERGLLCLNSEARRQAIAGFSRILRLAGLLIFDLSLRKEAPLFCYQSLFPAPWAPANQIQIQEAVDRSASNGHLIQHISVMERDREGRDIQSKEIELSLHFPDDGEIGRTLKHCRFSSWKLYGDFYCRMNQQADDYEIWVANRL